MSTLIDPRRVFFAGTRTPHKNMDKTTVQMIVNGVPTPLQFHKGVQTFSERFEWGYQGAGPAQLALAMCVELVGPVKALKVHDAVRFSSSRLYLEMTSGRSLD